MGRGKLIAGLEYTPISTGGKPKMEFKTMNDQKGDQAALNGLVNDYGWKPKIHDIMIHPDPIMAKWLGEFIIATRTELDCLKIIQRDRKKPVYPLAGTWVEGGLIELIGEQFHCLSYWPNGWHCEAYLEPHDKEVPTVYEGPTPIQALVAALRVLKQKEVGGG